MPKIFSTHICKKKHPQNYWYLTWKKSQPKAPPVVPFARSPRAPCGSAPSWLHSASAGAAAGPRRPPHAPHGRSRLGDIALWSSATFWEKKHGWYSISNIFNVIYVNMSWYISLIFFDLFFNFPLSVDIAAEIRQRWSAKTKTSTSSAPCDPSHVVLPLWENPPTKTTTWNFCRRASKALVDKESPLHSVFPAVYSVGLAWVPPLRSQRIHRCSWDTVWKCHAERSGNRLLSNQRSSPNKASTIVTSITLKQIRNSERFDNFEMFQASNSNQ